MTKIDIPSELKKIPLENNKYYYADRSGNIWSTFNGELKILKQQVNDKGYSTTAIHSKTYKVHRLIAITFIDNPEKKAEVNHIDLNKTNNCVSNLEWCTGQENMDHYYATVKRLGKQLEMELDVEIRVSKASKPIVQLSKEGQFIEWYRSMSEAGRKGYRISGISKCCNKLAKTHRKFKWMHLEDYGRQHLSVRSKDIG
jgi:hypothetical protein